jgi:hypothetical protein
MSGASDGVSRQRSNRWYVTKKVGADAAWTDTADHETLPTGTCSDAKRSPIEQ